MFNNFPKNNMLCNPSAYTNIKLKKLILFGKNKERYISKIY